MFLLNQYIKIIYLSNAFVKNLFYFLFVGTYLCFTLHVLYISPHCKKYTSQLLAFQTNRGKIMKKNSKLKFNANLMKKYFVFGIKVKIMNINIF